MDFLTDVFEAAKTVGAFAGLFVGLYLTLRATGLFNRPAFGAASVYHDHKDMVGFQTRPRFVVQLTNMGNVPVTFFDFETLIPRSGEKAAESVQPTADLYVDGESLGRVANVQEAEQVGYATKQIKLDPGENRTEFFDLGYLFPNIDWDKLTTSEVPDDFAPILHFRDSAGGEWHCDTSGCKPGPYKYPHSDHVPEALRTKDAPMVIRRRGFVTRKWRWVADTHSAEG